MQSATAANPPTTAPAIAPFETDGARRGGGEVLVEEGMAAIAEELLLLLHIGGPSATISCSEVGWLFQSVNSWLSLSARMYVELRKGLPNWGKSSSIFPCRL